VFSRTSRSALGSRSRPSLLLTGGSSVNIIPPMFRTHLLYSYLLLAPEGQTGAIWETSKIGSGPSESGGHWIERYFDLVTILISKGRFVICVGLSHTLREDQWSQNRQEHTLQWGNLVVSVLWSEKCGGHRYISGLKFIIYIYICINQGQPTV